MKSVLVAFAVACGPVRADLPDSFTLSDLTPAGLQAGIVAASPNGVYVMSQARSYHEMEETYVLALPDGTTRNLSDVLPKAPKTVSIDAAASFYSLPPVTHP